TLSTKSLEADETPPSAHNFLLRHGVAELEKAIAPGYPVLLGHVGVINQEGLAVAVFNSNLGDSSTPESSDDEEDAIEVDRQSVFALPSKELTRGPKVLKLEDVSTRQLAYVLATSVPFVHPSDLLQIGGEAEGLLEATVSRCKKIKDKNAESEAVQQVKAASNLWRHRLGKILDLITGKNASAVLVSSCKTLDDMTNLVGCLSKKQRRISKFKLADMEEGYEQLLEELRKDPRYTVVEEVRAKLQNMMKDAADAAFLALAEKEASLLQKEKAIAVREARVAEREEAEKDMRKIMSKPTSGAEEKTPVKLKKRRPRGSSSKRVGRKGAHREDGPAAVRRRLDFAGDDDGLDSGSRAEGRSTVEASPAEKESGGEDEDLFCGKFKQSKRMSPASAKRSTKQSGGENPPKQNRKTKSEEAGLDQPKALEKDLADKEPDEESESLQSDQEPPQPTKECSEAGALEVEPELLDLLTASTPSQDAPFCIKILQAEELTSLSEAADLLCDMGPSHFAMISSTNS
ncbi:unnamed protein product, partial [Symbiodinium sp. CCMP2592]